MSILSTPGLFASLTQTGSGAPLSLGLRPPLDPAIRPRATKRSGRETESDRKEKESGGRAFYSHKEETTGGQRMEWDGRASTSKN